MEAALRDLNQVHHLPVITLIDQQRVLTDADYANRSAIAVLDILLDLDARRGAGRLFVP